MFLPSKMYKRNSTYRVFDKSLLMWYSTNKNFWSNKVDNFKTFDIKWLNISILENIVEEHDSILHVPCVL